MKKLIKRILREHKEFKDNLFNLLNSGQDENIEMVKYLSEGQGYDLRDILIEYFQEYGPPYFIIFNILEITKEEQEYILNKIYGYRTIVAPPRKGTKTWYNRTSTIYDDKGYAVYRESSSGYWEEREYDQSRNKTYWVDSDGKIYSYV
jgi:hypothetical protein